MKKLIASIVFSTITSSAFASYPLICRGGGSMKLNTLASFYQSTNGVVMQPNIDLFFTKASGPSGAQGEYLNPGECSWLDRAINNAEPSAISDQYLTGQSVTVMSQTSATGSKIIDVASIYSPLTNSEGSRYFIKVFVNGSGGPFVRDPAQKIQTFIRP